MEIGIELLQKMTHMLELNGRQFILRDAKIKEMKSTETYDVSHGNDLIYFSIKSTLIKSTIDAIYHYGSDGESMKIAWQHAVESTVKGIEDLGSHEDFMKAMDLKHSIKI